MSDPNNNQPLDPDALADYLDALFSGDTLPDSAEDPLIDAALQLSRAPKPELSASSFERIRHHVLDANQQATVMTGAGGLSTMTIIGIMGAVIVVLIIIGSLLTGALSPDESSVDTPVQSGTTEITQAVTETVDIVIVPLEETEEATAGTPTEMPQETIDITEVAVANEAESTEIPTDTPTSVPTTTSEPTATYTQTPTQTATATALPVILVIEGPVREIIDNSVFIFDFEIELEPDDPLLDVLEVGDSVRVDGSLDYDNITGANNTVALQPIVVEPINDTIIAINEDTGEAWRDNNSCNNPPPDWAPAYGWRARCENAPAPGNSGNAPGQGGNSPGNSGNAPGQGGNSPGNSGNAPGQIGNSPGNSGNAPGHGGNNPGNGNGNGNGRGNNNDDDDDDD